MPVYSFRTLQSSSTGMYKEKGSKFLAFAYPVQTEDEIRDKLNALDKKHFDARHHCFAWMLGAEKKSFRSYDDGEPNHSAGDPILGQIRSKDLTDVLVVVVRYFGGTKLGVGGLVTAYKTAAEDALTNAMIIEKSVVESIDILFDYSSTPDVMKLVKDFQLEVINQSFETQCSMMVEYKLRDREELMDKIKLMSATGVKIKIANNN